jgi:hypothetical protein
MTTCDSSIEDVSLVKIPANKDNQQVMNQLGTLTLSHRGKINYMPKTFDAVELCDE